MIPPAAREGVTMPKRQRVVKMKPTKVWLHIVKHDGSLYGFTKEVKRPAPFWKFCRIVGPITLREPARRKRKDGERDAKLNGGG